jgi:hypothetical protein
MNPNEPSKLSPVDALIKSVNDRASWPVRMVPFIRVDVRPDMIRASLLPMVERHQITGFQFTRADFTYRITRWGTHLGFTLPDYCIQDVEDPFRGYLAENFREVRRIVALIEAADDPIAVFDLYRHTLREDD